MATKTWSAAGAGSASTDANWNGGTKPVAGDDIVFDATSTKNCTWDLTDAFLSFTIAAGYAAGVITQSVAMNIGAGGFSQAGGTFTGDETNWMTCAGDISVSGGTFTFYKTFVRMSGANKSILTDLRPKNLDITGTITIANTKTVTVFGGNFSVSGNLTITGQLDLYDYVWTGGGTIINNGVLNVYFTYSSPTLDSSGIVLSGSGTIYLRIGNDDGTSRKLTLGANFSCGLVELVSAHGVATATLDLAGYTLTCTTLTIGTRGIVTGSQNSIITGNVVLNAASAILTQTATKSLTINGDLTLTDGTITQLGDITVSGDYAQAGGTLIPSFSYNFNCAGDYTKSAGAMDDNSLNLVMNGTTQTIDAPIIVNNLTINQGSVTTVMKTMGTGYNIAAGRGMLTIRGILRCDGVAWFNCYKPSGITITGDLKTGTGYLNVKSLDANPQNMSGFSISGNLLIYNEATYATDSTTLLNGNVRCKKLLITSENVKNVTLDLNGYNLESASIEVGGGFGILLGGEGQIRCNGTFDASAGTFTKETSTLVMGAVGNLKLGGAKDLYNLACLGASDVTLQSDVTVSNFYAHVNPVKPGAFTLTKSRPDLEYTGLRRPFKRPNSRPYRYGIADRWIEELLAGGT